MKNQTPENWIDSGPAAGGRVTRLENACLVTGNGTWPQCKYVHLYRLRQRCRCRYGNSSKTPNSLDSIRPAPHQLGGMVDVLSAVSRPCI